VWLLGPLVKAAGFRTLLLVMAGIAAITLCVVLLLPRSTVHGLGRDDLAPERAD
jgi:uncharacterized membrane protein YhiD involved in acid resistance